jgi:hypothetical protein
LTKIGWAVLKLFAQHLSWISLFPPQSEGVWGHNSSNSTKMHIIDSNHIFRYIVWPGQMFGLGRRRVAEKRKTEHVKPLYFTLPWWSVQLADLHQFLHCGHWGNEITNCAKFRFDRSVVVGSVVTLNFYVFPYESEVVLNSVLSATALTRDWLVVDWWH